MSGTVSGGRQGRAALCVPALSTGARAAAPPVLPLAHRDAWAEGAKHGHELVIAKVRRVAPPSS